MAPTLSSRSWSHAILKSAAPAALVFRLLVASGCLCNLSETLDSGRRTDDPVMDGSDDIVKDHDKEISLPLGLLFNLMDVAENNGEALLLQTGQYSSSGQLWFHTDVFFLELSINCSCTPLCLRQCRCDDRKTGVNLLCDIFNRQQDKRIDNVRETNLKTRSEPNFIICLAVRCIPSGLPYSLVHQSPGAPIM